jgi:hypothetical protein
VSDPDFAAGILEWFQLRVLIVVVSGGGLWRVPGRVWGGDAGCPAAVAGREWLWRLGGCAAVRVWRVRVVGRVVAGGGGGSAEGR